MSADELARTDTEVMGTGRREVLGKAAIAAAVAAVSGVAVARRADAADGGTMLIGRNNQGNTANDTQVSSGTSLYANNGISHTLAEAAGVPNRRTALYAYQDHDDGNLHGDIAITGHSNGVNGMAVYGRSEGSGDVAVYGEFKGGVSSGGGQVEGIGIIGVSNGGVAIAAAGTTYDVQAYGTGRIYLSADGVTNPPSGTNERGQLARDPFGDLWYCTTTGTPGTWRNLSTPAPTFTSVVTNSLLAANGTVTNTMTIEKLVLHSTSAGAPTTGTWAQGSLVSDTAGALWYCTAAGTPGTWVNLLAHVPVFHPITPGRVYDSRGMTPAGPLAAGSSRVVAVRDRVDAASYVVDAANYVPSGATAVTANVTVVATVGAGFLAVNPKGDATVHAATVNWWSADQILNNGVTLTLGGDRELNVIAGGSGGAQTHFVIDVTGYYL